MQHLDPDRLVVLAFSDSTAADDEAVHLAECAGCRAEIDTLKHVADLGAETQDLHDLPPPPEKVWAGIAAEVARAESSPAPVVDLAEAREKRRRRPRWLAPAVAAAAAAGGRARALAEKSKEIRVESRALRTEREARLAE